MRESPVLKKVTPALVVVAVVVSSHAQERVDHDTFWKIRQEATTNSRILRTVHMLADRYGPRPTGSPNLRAAGEWAVTEFESWGLQNGRMEPWDWGNPGWLNERLAAHITSPVKDHLVAEALAWTPGTKGPVQAAVVQITLPVRPTKQELSAHLEALREKVKGKIVLVGAHQQVSVTFNDVPERREDREVLQILNAPPAAGRGAPPSTQKPTAPERQPLTNTQITAQLYEFLLSAGALVRVNDAGRDHGQIRAFANNTYDPGRAIPTVVLRNEDYGRISRLLADGEKVELEFDIVNRIYPEGRTSYNATAEIPGTTDEIVMVGGHLDSWHAATGATDNAIGCAVAMEAVRILKAIGVTPRRTIRLALWSGEEQGLRGSRAYVRQQFGTFEEPKPAYSEIVGLCEHRLRHGSRAFHDRVRSSDGRGRASRGARAVQGSRRARCQRDAQPAVGQLRSLVIQRSRAARYQHAAGSHRVPQSHLAQQPGYLRAHCGRRCDQVGNRACGDGLSSCDA